MGVLVVWAAPTSEATWTHSRVYRSTSQGGSYTQIVQQTLDTSNPDTTYFDENGGSNNWYKVSFYNSGTLVESSLSDAFQVPSNTTSYTSPSRVASRLQIRNSQNLAQFDGTTKPNIFEVIEMIQEVEDRIDRLTNHAWRSRYSYDSNDSNDYEIHNVENPYKYVTGIPIYLNHRHLRSLSAASGDVFQLWNGSEWEDWLANRTEGRGNDYWVDHRQGIIFLRTYIYWRRPLSVRLRYRYGEQTVAEDVKRAATYLVAADIARNDDRSFLLPEGSQNVDLGKKIELWEKQAYDILDTLKELPVAVT